MHAVLSALLAGSGAGMPSPAARVIAWVAASLRPSLTDEAATILADDVLAANISDVRSRLAIAARPFGDRSPPFEDLFRHGFEAVLPWVKATSSFGNAGYQALDFQGKAAIWLPAFTWMLVSTKSFDHAFDFFLILGTRKS